MRLSSREIVTEVISALPSSGSLIGVIVAAS